MVAINGRLYESIAPIRRAALRLAPESPALQEQLARARGWVRGEVERVFADELAAAAAATPWPAVELALSFEAWDQLRTAQGLSPARRRRHRHPRRHGAPHRGVTRSRPRAAPARDGG